MTNSGKISFTGILFITFLILKLTKVINWSWWWITAPLWMPFGLLLFIMIICFIILGKSEFMKAFKIGIKYKK